MSCILRLGPYVLLLLLLLRLLLLLLLLLLLRLLLLLLAFVPLHWALKQIVCLVLLLSSGVKNSNLSLSICLPIFIFCPDTTVTSLMGH